MGRPVAAGAATPGEVVSMSRAGVNPQLIVNYINTSGVAQPASPQDVITMTQQGVPPEVIQAMQTPRVRTRRRSSCLRRRDQSSWSKSITAHRPATARRAMVPTGRGSDLASPLAISRPKTAGLSRSLTRGRLAEIAGFCDPGRVSWER